MTDQETGYQAEPEEEANAVSANEGEGKLTAAEEVSIAELQESLAECRDQANEYLDGWQRARAEFDNYRKRVRREQELAYQTAAGSVIRRFLEGVDDLERALKTLPEEGEGTEWAEGIELVYRKLRSILESEGVQAMDAQGKMFDPTMHEAVTSEETNEYESGQIIEVLQKGYLMGDRVLRPAMVRVAR